MQGDIDLPEDGSQMNCTLWIPSENKMKNNKKHRHSYQLSINNVLQIQFYLLK